MVGLRTGRRFRMGDHVTIKVIAANLDKRQLDYEWVTEVEGKAKPVKGKATKAPNKSASKTAVKKVTKKK